MRSVVEEVVEGVLFEVEAGVSYLVTDEAVRGGEAVRVEQIRAPLSVHVLKRLGG